MADFTKLDDLLRGFAENSVPGCACAIARDGKLLYEGIMDTPILRRNSRSRRVLSSVRPSMTKLVTYTILMMLYEQGKGPHGAAAFGFFPRVGA